MSRFVVVVFVFGVVNEVRDQLLALDHLKPTLREASDGIVFVTVEVVESDPEAASEYARQAIGRQLRRSVMVQSVIAAP